jgi:hypothetical protein
MEIAARMRGLGELLRLLDEERKARFGRKES